MSIFLLVIIYLIFISLGIPDPYISSCWPSICQSFEISSDMQGIIIIIISVFTILSSFFTAFLNKHLKIFGTIVLSIGLTVAGIFCMAYSSNFILLCLSCVPLGLGAGAIDATLNNYVAINYKAIHLNFLHAFWGVGTFISPLIIGSFLTETNNDSWRTAGLVLGIIQVCILIVTICTCPVWFKMDKEFQRKTKDEKSNENEKSLGFFKTFKLKGVLLAIIGFFCYCAIEQTAYQWYATMLVLNLEVEDNLASNRLSLFFIGMVVGRFISGFVSLKIKDKNLIRIGEGILLVGLILLTFTFNIYIMPVAICLIGLGCAPIYPAIVHDTPNRFTPKYSASVMSVQIGCAYLSNVTISPLFGVLGENTTYLALPYVLIGLFIIMVLCNEFVLIRTKNKDELLK